MSSLGWVGACSPSLFNGVDGLERSAVARVFVAAFGAGLLGSPEQALRCNAIAKSHRKGFTVKSFRANNARVGRVASATFGFNKYSV